MWRIVFKYVVATTIGFLIVQVLLLYKKKSFRPHKEAENQYHPRSNSLSIQPLTPSLVPWSHAVEGIESHEDGKKEYEAEEGVLEKLEGCRTFEYDPVKWTLTWKTYDTNIQHESKKCSNLYQNLTSDGMIKREVYMNGTHRNTGCQVHTPKCSPGAHWNKQFNLRVDTPPCCMEKMLHVFRTVTHDLKAYNISHMVFGGAVLGYARNQQFVPYDNDLDLWMNGTFWDSQLFTQIRHNWTAVHGFAQRMRDWGGKLKIYISEQNNNGLDIWPWYDENTTVFIARDYDLPKWDVPRHLVFPLKSVTFLGVDTHVPGDPEGYCEWQYGKDWKTEKNCTVVEDTKCVV